MRDNLITYFYLLDFKNLMTGRGARIVQAGGGPLTAPRRLVISGIQALGLRQAVLAGAGG
jgi:hypothetical protein